MPYASPLETRLAKKVTKAITDYGLIEDGDRVMVGLVRRQGQLGAVPDPGRPAEARADRVFPHRRDGRLGVRGLPPRFDLEHVRGERGWEYRIVHTEIGEVMDDLLEAQATPCSLCARLRRGVLYRLADEVGATKIALGHHLDDFVETLLLNLFFAGTLKAMPAKLVSDDRRHVVIRPLVAVTESDARAYAKQSELPIIGCCCPACGDLGLQRQRVKRLIAELEVEHAEVKSSMIRALANVAPRHLLDRRLNPPADLRRAAAEREADEGAVPLPLVRR